MENGLKGWTGKWLCRKCYYDTDYRHRHNSTNNIIKAMAGRRTGYLNNNSTDALGDICEAITCKVRV